MTRSPVFLLLLSACGSSVDPTREATSAATPSDAGTGTETSDDAGSMTVEASADAPVYSLPFGAECTTGGTPCAAAAYDGPLIATWGCYAVPGSSTMQVCSFRCDDYTGTPGGSAADAQVSYDQTKPPVCTQLGGTCVADPSLPGDAGEYVVLGASSPSLCIVTPPDQ
jgi:hypothetical protein